MAQAPRRACGLTSPGETPQNLVSGRKGVHSSVGIAAAAGIALMIAGPAHGLPVSYRTIDGTGNNLNHPSWGSAGIRYRREASGSHYEDGISAPNGQSRPGPREISNLIVAQGDLEIENARNLSTALYEFGQFLDHDIGLAASGSTEAFNIPVPAGDPYFDPENTGVQIIPFKRSAFDPTTGATNPRQQINTVTAFIDASQIYGSDPARAQWLRTGTGGHLKVNAETYGDMLPYNDGTLSNDNPTGLPATSLYVAGDVRANEQVGLTTLHVVFLREHNWQADRLHNLHPSWSDSKLYKEARRWVGAEMQVIVYKEWLPALLGQSFPAYTGYHPNVNPGLSNAFATAAFRIGHSMVGPDIDLLDEDFEEVGVLDLAESFFNPLAIPEAGGIDPIVRYFAASVQQETDTMIVDQLRNFLFGPPGAGGFDLASLNIQRGRDHGLADYNTMRQDFGLPRVTSFSQITSKAQLAQQLQALYGDVDDIDPWVGMLAEDHLPGASLGPTHTAIFIDQFKRLRDGDRYWYKNDGFSSGELAILNSTRLGKIIERNTGFNHVQDDVFYALDPSKSCHGECAADFDDGSGNGVPDGVVNAADLVYYINLYGDGEACADIDDGSGSGAPDGDVDIHDLIYFLQHFYDGC